MGLFRFCRFSLRALVLLIERFPLFLRLSWACLAVSLVSTAAAEHYPLLGGITDLLARGVFAVAWLRLIALDEAPPGPGYFRTGRREILTALGWMTAEMFITFPAQVIAASLALAVGIPLADAVQPLLALTHLLLGAAYMLPTEAALERGDGKEGWRLPDLVMKGGVAISVAVFLAWLPANLALEAIRALPPVELLDGLTLTQALTVATRYLALALTAGTMALIWNQLGTETD